MIGKVLYGAAFTLVLPVLLVLWARATADVVPLAVPEATALGAALVITGAVLVIAGWFALRVHGGGLPMNAFPPPRYVTRGVYALLAHPIYVGFCGAVLGVALVTRSASGLWLVTPAVVLGSVALVLGYERRDLLTRFGSLARPFLALPGSEGPIRRGDRAFVWLCVLAPWAAIYEAIASLGTPPDAIDTSLSFERSWPVLAWTEPVYASIYLVAIASPLVAKTRADLRALSVQALLSMALVFPLYLALPFIAPPRPFTPTSALGELLALERTLDTPGCALPSFHVVFALILAGALASRTRAAWLWAAAVSASCITTGMHTLLDVVAGVGAWLLVRRAGAVWELVRRASERVAGSWREVHLGSVRIINHGVWAALGTTLGLVVLGSFVPRASLIALVWICTVCGAALWAQWIEGASGLSRPFGFWGGAIGAATGAIAGSLMGIDPWVVLAAIAVAAPFAQALGRLRCLVQGCCHGSDAPPAIGIRYTHPRSRVARSPELFGRPVHPTPLYSIAWNVVIAIVVVRLAQLHAATHLVGGVYLVLMGLGRFVEESYRGEPQTPVLARLRLYQWAAAAAVLVGAAATALGHGPPMPSPTLTLEVACATLVSGALSMVAFGVDVPRSKRRFSRLA